MKKTKGQVYKQNDGTIYRMSHIDERGMIWYTEAVICGDINEVDFDVLDTGIGLWGTKEDKIADREDIEYLEACVLKAFEETMSNGNHPLSENYEHYIKEVNRENQKRASKPQSRVKLIAEYGLIGDWICLEGDSTKPLDILEIRAYSLLCYKSWIALDSDEDFICEVYEKDITLLPITDEYLDALLDDEYNTDRFDDMWDYDNNVAILKNEDGEYQLLWNGRPVKEIRHVNELDNAFRFFSKNDTFEN